MFRVVWISFFLLNGAIYLKPEDIINNVVPTPYTEFETLSTAPKNHGLTGVLMDFTTKNKISLRTKDPYIGPIPGREILEVHIGGTNIHYVNLTKLSQILTPQLLVKLWEEANVTEELYVTLTKHNYIYKTETSVVIAEKFKNTNHICPVPANQVLLNGSTDYNIANQVTGYLGEFGISSNKILSELFYYTSDVLKPRPSYHEIFYSMRTHCVYISLSFIDGNYQLAGFITRDFTFLTLIRTETSKKTHTLTLLFGFSDRLPTLKGYLV